MREIRGRARWSMMGRHNVRATGRVCNKWSLSGESISVQNRSNISIGTESDQKLNCFKQSRLPVAVQRSDFTSLHGLETRFPANLNNTHVDYSQF